MPTALTKREEQGLRSRGEILDAAETLMSSRGYAGTSIAELAKCSGLPASSIYWHFASKAGVLAAVMERGAERFFQDSTLRTTDDWPADPPDRLFALLSRSVAVIRAHPQFLRLFMLMLLGIEGEGFPSAVVARVRSEGSRALAEGVRRAYEPWGAALAGEVSARLAALAVVMFDGLFIASQVEAAEVGSSLVRQCVEAMHSVAESMRAG